MKSCAWLPVLGLLVGCSTPWEDTGKQGPWCAPNSRARVLYRTVDALGAPNPQSETAFENEAGVKKTRLSFWRELDEYLDRCAFIDEWPADGTVDSVTQHKSPYDFYLVSMDPTIVIGVERENSESTTLIDPAMPFVGSTHLSGHIEVRTTLPYHAGATVVWFSPAESHQLHKLDVGDGTASFTIPGQARISVAVEKGTELVTSRD